MTLITPRVGDTCWLSCKRTKHSICGARRSGFGQEYPNGLNAGQGVRSHLHANGATNVSRTDHSIVADLAEGAPSRDQNRQVADNPAVRGLKVWPAPYSSIG